MTSESDPQLSSIVDALLESYRSDPRGHHIDRHYLPSRTEILESVQLMLQLLYPGYFGRQGLTSENVGYHTGVLVSTLRDKLEGQIELCLSHQAETEKLATSECPTQSRKVANAFLARLPALRQALLDDVQAAFDGDPAATNLDEVILAYPGLLAVTVYRIAHELHEMGVPLMPRIMTEWAHSETGADIHPGAKIGKSFFIDHATGVVVGETTRIGANVKLYQGVTLGALSHPRDERGRVIRNTKRHPTVEDGVTVYANATVLGGETALGTGSVVGGSVFLTESVPARSRVAIKAPELRVLTHDDG
jgi:serine O-acetyltransferase